MMNIPEVRFTKNQVRELRRQNATWPLMLVRVPRWNWPSDPFRNPGVIRQEVLRSRDFLVQVFEDGAFVRLSVNRTDYDLARQRFRKDITWDELQRLKCEAGFGNYWAVEVFPPPSEVINVANMRHLWVLPEMPLYGWSKGRKS